MAHRKENLWIGSGLIFAAAALYAGMGVLVKLGKDIPDTQMVFIRNLICLLILLPYILLPRPKTLKTKVPFSHLIRSLAGLSTMYLFFYSIRHVSLVDAQLLNNTMPLFIPLIMWLWKREKISLKLIPALFIGFLGVLFVLKPGSNLFHIGLIAALGSGFFMAISMSGIRELGRTEPIYRILFYYFFIGTVISAIPLIWTWEHPTPEFWAILVGIGLVGAIYQFVLTMGYQFAPAAKISPIIYFAVLFSGIFDWLIWNQKPTYLSYIGAVLVIIGAIWSLRVENPPPVE